MNSQCFIYYFQDYDSPLSLACKAGNVDIVLELIRNGALIDSKDEVRQT